MESLSGIIYVALCVQSEGSSRPGERVTRGIEIIKILKINFSTLHFTNNSDNSNWPTINWTSFSILLLVYYACDKVSQFQMFSRLAWSASLSSSCIHDCQSDKSCVSQEALSVSSESTGFFNIVKSGLWLVVMNPTRKLGKRNPSHKTEFSVTSNPFPLLPSSLPHGGSAKCLLLAPYPLFWTS